MANLSLVFDLLARDNASGSFRDVGNAADRAGRQTTTFGSSMAGAMKVAGAALLGAGLVEGFKSLYNAAAESQKIGRLTEQVIKSTGGAAQVSAKQIGDLAGAIAAKTGIDDEAIQSGQNLLLTFTNIKNAAGAGNDIFNQTTQIMTDMSVALGKDASASAVMLGKALNDPIRGITALSRAGVSFTEQQKEQIRTLVESGDVLGAQKIILAELGKEFGGAAEAASTPLEKLQVRLGNFAEELGGHLVPLVDRAADFFSNKLLPALEPIGPIFSAMVTAVGTAASAIVDLVGWFSDLPAPIIAGTAALVGFNVLGPLVVASVRGIGFAWGVMTASIAASTGPLAVARGAIGGLVGFLGGPWGLAIAGAAAGLTLFTSMMGDNGDVTEQARTAQRDFAAALRESKGALDENVRSAAAKAAQDSGLLDAAERAGISLSLVTDAVLGNGAAYDQVTGALNRYVEAQTVGGERAGSRAGQVLTEQGRAADAARNSLDVLAPTVARTRAEQEQLAAATEATSAATDGASASQQTFAQMIEVSRDELNEAKQATDDFKLALDILTGANVSLIQVESAFQDALADATGAMEGLNGSVLNGAGNLDLQSEAGRKAADVLLDVRNSGNDLIATMLAQGATSDEVRAKDAELRQSFINTAGQMGISRDAALRLADQILGIPAERTTTINADTQPAREQVAAFLRGLSGSGATITVAAGAVSSFLSGFTNRAFGGPIPGSSPHKRADNIPVMATAGEYMHNVDAVDYYGVAFMDALNRRQIPRGDLQYLADGGPVASAAYPFNVNTAKLFNVVYPTAAAAGPVGSGSLVGTWTSIWNAVKAAIPQARQNSTYRPGDPGYHGRNKAIDFGFGSGPGGAGSAGLASINRFLHDKYGGSLAELIYDGVGDDRPDLYRGKPHTYNAGTRAEHRNHVHAAVYDQGGILPPGLTVAYNGTGRSETIRTAGQEAALRQPAVFHLYDSDGVLMGTIQGRAEAAAASALGLVDQRQDYSR